MRTMIRVCITFVILVYVLSACQPAEELNRPTATTAATEPSLVAATTVPTAPPLPTSTQPPIPPTIPPATPVPTETPLPAATPTPHPLHPFTIQGMREQTFAGGQITTRSILEETNAFTRSYITYPSDRLTITGVMHRPHGEGPFPVLILLHGYADRDQYYAGLGTWQAADFFARQGYIVIAPDFRSWGESDSGLSLFHMGLVADTLHLISSIPSLPQADSEQIGLWGHSMGGGVAMKVLTIDPRVKAAVLYAPNSADDADLIARWGLGCLSNQSQNAGDVCNPGEVIPTDSPPELIEAYQIAGSDPAFLREVAPLYHLGAVTAPIQIHIGSADGGPLAATPPDWSEKLAAELLDHNRQVDYFTYEGQGHFFAGESWTLFLHRASELYDQELKSAP